MTKSVLRLILFFMISMIISYANPLYFPKEMTFKFGEFPEELLQQTCCPYDTSADAYALLDIGKITIDPYDFRLTTEIHQRIQIYNDDGKDYANVKIPYWHEDKVYDIKACTYLPNGKKIKLKRKMIKTEGDKKSYLTKSFTLPGVVDNCIIEYTYTISTKYLHFLKPWFFQSRIPTKVSRLIVAIPEGFNYNAFLRNSPIPNYKADKQILKDHDSKKKFGVFVWNFNNLIAITDESYIKSYNDILLSLNFQLVEYKSAYNYVKFIDSWDDIREKIYDYHKPFLENSGYTKKYCSEIIGDKTDEAEIARRLYYHLRDEFDLLEESSIYIESTPKSLIKAKAGSDVEKNLLYISMLNSLGISATPVLISTRSHGEVMKELPNIRKFNHLIVRAKINKKTRYLDLSSKYCPFETIHYAYQVNNGFMYTKSSHSFVNIPKDFTPSKSTSTTFAMIKNDGSLTAKSTVKYDGMRNLYYRRKLDNYDEDLEEFIKDYILDNVDNIEIDSCFVVKSDSNDNEIVFTANYSVPNFLNIIGKNAYFKPALIDKIDENPFKLENRTYPVDFSYKTIEEETVTYNFVDTFEISEVPENSRNGMFKLSCNVDYLHSSNQLRYHRVKNRSLNQVLPDKYRNLKQVYSTMMDQDNNQVILKLK